MNKEIQKLQKELDLKVEAAKKDLILEGIKKVLTNADVAKYIKNGKLNTSSLMSSLRNEINKVIANVERSMKR